MKGRAFTLTELVVAIGIVALLLLVLSPSVSKAWRVARQTICQNNLSQLSTVLTQASGTDLAQPASITQVSECFPDWRAWPGQALAIAGPEVLRCPEDDLSDAPDLAALRRRIEYRTTANPGVSVPLVGPVVSQYFFSRTGSNSKGTYTEYTFEEAGNIQYWASRPNYEYWNPICPPGHNDGWIRIYDSTVDIEIISQLCPGREGELYIDNKPAFGTNDSNIASHVGQTIKAGSGLKGVTSYGVNSFAHRYAYGRPALVLMDYKSDGNTMCADPDEPAKVRQELLKSLRHFNRVNLLMADGSVRLAGLSQIDPAQNRALWNPNNLAPHADD